MLGVCLSGCLCVFVCGFVGFTVSSTRKSVSEPLGQLVSNIAR